MYALRVTGCNNVPTFATIAALPLFTSAAISGTLGCSAYPGSPVSGSNVFCCSASGPRTAL